MADERVRILLEAKDNASATINKVSGSLGNMQPQASGLAGVFGKLTPVLGMAAGAFAAVGAASVALDFTRAGASAEALSESFDRMASAAGQSSEQMLSAMQQASSGTIANTDLILAANRAMSFGVANTGQEMASLIQLAMAQAAKMGISATQAFNDLVTGVGRLSPMILDNLGVTVSAEKAYADYAATLGKTAEQLNQTEQRQAFLNAMMAAAPNAANEAGIAADSAAGGFQRMDAAMANLTTATGAFLSGPGGEFADWVATVANGAAGFLNPSDTQKTNAAIADTSRLIADLENQIAAVNGEFVNLGLVASEALPTDITMPAPLMTEQDAIVISEAAVNVDELNRQLEALIVLRNTLQSAGDPLAMDGRGQADAWLAQQREAAAQAVALAEETAAAVAASYDQIGTSTSAQIDTLTKGLIDSMGAIAALDLNSSLKAEMTDIIAAYQAAGISAEMAGYLMVEWLNAEAESARGAAVNTNTFARSAGNAATASARSIAPLRAMAGALQSVAFAAAGGSGTGRMDKWERLNYDLTGTTPKAAAMKDGMDALGAAFDDASFSAGGFGGAVADSFSGSDGIAGMVSGLLSGALSTGVGVDTANFLPREDAINEDARRLADVMVNGFGSPWASYFQTEFPALFQQMTAGGDIQAGAAQMLSEFEAGLRPELINQDLVKERVKAMIVGDANMAALAQEITAELQAELAGVDPASISGMVNGALGIGETGVGPGIEDELGNAALQGKIQGTGTTAGKSWGNAFLAYVQDNVPATLVGLLVDLVTPGVRAKITADASAEGAT